MEFLYANDMEAVRGLSGKFSRGPIFADDSPVPGSPNRENYLGDKTLLIARFAIWAILNYRKKLDN